MSGLEHVLEHKEFVVETWQISSVERCPSSSHLSCLNSRHLSCPGLDLELTTSELARHPQLTLLIFKGRPRANNVKALSASTAGVVSVGARPRANDVKARSASAADAASSGARSRAKNVGPRPRHGRQAASARCCRCLLRRQDGRLLLRQDRCLLLKQDSSRNGQDRSGPGGEITLMRATRHDLAYIYPLKSRKQEAHTRAALHNFKSHRLTSRLHWISPTTVIFYTRLGTRQRSLSNARRLSHNTWLSKIPHQHLTATRAAIVIYSREVTLSHRSA